MPAAPKGRRARNFHKRTSSDLSGQYEISSSSMNLFENKMGLATLGLAGVLIFIHVVLMIQSGDIFIIKNSVLLPWAQINGLILQGEVWRLITSIFVHANIIHLGGNLLFLLIFGLRLEELKGPYQMIAIFIITGIGGNLLTLGLSIFGGSALYFSSVGASGGVEGLFGANITFMYLDNKYGKSGLAFLSFLVIFFLITIGANTNFVAHLGGLLTGVVYAYVLERYINKK